MMRKSCEVGLAANVHTVSNDCVHLDKELTMHPSHESALLHGSIDDRIACATFFPSVELLLIYFPLDFGKLLLERSPHADSGKGCCHLSNFRAIGAMSHLTLKSRQAYVIVKVPPGTFHDPGSRSTIAPTFKLVAEELFNFIENGSDRNHSGSQVRRKSA